MLIRLKGFIPVLEPGVLGFLQFPGPTRLSQFDFHTRKPFPSDTASPVTPSGGFAFDLWR